MADKPPQLRPWGGRKGCAVLTQAFVVSFVIWLPLVTGIYFLVTFLDRQFPSEDTVFTVAITGVTGLELDPARDVDPPTALSPVFNLTFQIDNTGDSVYDACVAGLSRADVSYGDAFLAAGSVPPLCAGEKRRSDRVAARASGENVVVPRFFRDQLAAELAAGDASMDVKVTMPTYCWNGWCGGAVLSCKPKIGGGTSPACRLDLGWTRLPSFFQYFL
jgi:hypothetical protein